MDNFVYCSECHSVFFDVAAKTCHICREGTLRDISHLIKNTAARPLAPYTTCPHCNSNVYDGVCDNVVCPNRLKGK